MNFLIDSCEYKHEASNYYGRTILASVYIFCPKIIIQIAIFYKRGKFLWIPNDFYRFGRSKYFSDIPRSLNRFIFLKNKMEYNYNVFFLNKNLIS